MKSQLRINYCQHFQHFKANKKIKIQNKSFCKFCINQNYPLWLCLHKNCNTIVCSKSGYKHLDSHLEQSKKLKSFHSIYMNICTAQIRCIHCDLQIYDLEKIPQKDRKNIVLNEQYNNPLKFRYIILPHLTEIGQAKIMGQLQFSEGHQKANKCLVGIFADKYNYSIIPAIQFISHCDFFRQIVLNIKLCSSSKDNNKILLLKQLKNIFSQIQCAKQRAIRIQELFNYIIKFSPQLQGYKRKNPFESILFLLNIIHENLNYYRVIDKIQNFGYDQWDLFYKNDKIQSHCPIYDSLQSILTFQYKCLTCENIQQHDQSINFLTFDIPKKKRNKKIIQQQLQEKGYSSPRKRGKSLMSIILPEQQLPITLPELFIDFLKRNLHPQKHCSSCKNDQIPMKPINMIFKKLADFLIIHINRFSKINQSIDQTEILIDYNSVNLESFCKQNNQTQINEQKQKQQNHQIQRKHIYQFFTAIGIQKGTFPVICRSKYNGQIYVLKNQIVQMLGKSKFNPYVICFKRNQNQTTLQYFNEIIKQNTEISSIIKKDKSITSSQTQFIQLPDFYHIQLKYGIQRSVYEPMSCKHWKIKPIIERKSQQKVIITKKLYENLVNKFGGSNITNQICSQCVQQVQALKNRKKKQKQMIINLDKIKTNSNVMISMSWLKNWTHYLYSNQILFYFHKGFPSPPPIDNKNLLQNNKCRRNLIKNKDFKVINIFIFKFLKQLYGGGPEIRYKWNNQTTTIDEIKIKQIKQVASILKKTNSIVQTQSNRKSIILQKNSSYMETVNESQIQQSVFDNNHQS